MIVFPAHRSIYSKFTFSFVALKFSRKTHLIFVKRNTINVINLFKVLCNALSIFVVSHNILVLLDAK